MNFYFFFIKTASATPRKTTAATIVAAWFVSPVLAIASAELLSAPPGV